MTKPSPTQQQVIDKLTETGKWLYRFGGGFWTWDGCPIDERGVPTWYVTIQTVRAMETKGLLERSWFYVEEWKDHRHLASGVSK